MFMLFFSKHLLYRQQTKSACVHHAVLVTRHWFYMNAQSVSNRTEVVFLLFCFFILPTRRREFYQKDTITMYYIQYILHTVETTELKYNTDPKNHFTF